MQQMFDSIKPLFVSKFECLYSSNICLLNLGCPLRKGSSDRRLRRRAATASIDFLAIYWKLFRSFRKKSLSSESSIISFYLGCRSTPVRHAANPNQPERHPDAQEKLKHYMLSTRL